MVRKYILILLFFLPWPLFAFVQEKELFSEAESRYLSGKYLPAYETYDEFIRTYPLSELTPDVQYRKALCLYRLEKYREAIQQFDLVEKRYRMTRYMVLVPLWKGVSYYYTADYPKAIENLDAFLNKGDQHELIFEALLYKALSSISIGRVQDGREAMERLVNARGDKVSTYESVLYSYTLLAAGNYDQLIEFYTSIDPETFAPEWREKIYLYTAEAYWKSGDTGKAEEIYRMLVDRHLSTASTAYRRLYSVAQKRGDFQEMERVVQQAEQRFAGDPEILKDFWLRMGVASYDRSEFDLAAYFLRKVWNLDDYPEMPEAVPLYLSEVDEVLGKNDDARAILEAYVRENRGTTGLLYFKLANLYLKSGNYKGSADYFDRYIKRYPKSKYIPEARYLLAYALYRQKKYEDAVSQCLMYEKSTGGSRANGESLEGSVVMLKARSLMELKRYDEALNALASYSNTAPNDLDARFEKVKLLYFVKNYEALIEETESLFRDFPDLEHTSANYYLNAQYLRGLSFILMKKYTDAVKTLSVITPDNTAGLPSIYPSTLYYRAWALYRIDRFADARKLAEEFIARFRDSDLYFSALYLAAWCSFSMNDYGTSVRLFSRLFEEAGEDTSAGKAPEDGRALAQKALFLSGKSLANLGKLARASEVYSELYKKHPKSAFADDALFENAGILLKQGQTKDGAEEYYRLVKQYPESPLAQEAFYRRGEALFSGGYYADAKNAFHEYRNQFPKGDLVDASLYWEGYSAQKLGQDRESALLWEKLITGFVNSSFRPDALKETAEVYVKFGQYRRALQYYTVLEEEYPTYAKSVNSSLRQEEIRYLVFGLSKREAELTAVISKKGGADTAEGRKAMIELARLYINEETNKIERAFQLLSRVMEKGRPQTRQEAGVLLGEYYYKTGDIERAGREFFNASLIYPENSDLMAYAIYRAAQMMKLAGKTREFKELVEKLSQSFPASNWSQEGRKLLEEKSE